MNMLISLLWDFSGYIAAGIGTLAAVWFGVSKIKGGERDKIAGENAIKTAEVQRKQLDAAAAAPRDDDQLVDRMRRGGF